MSYTTFDPDYAVPPGATLLETINSLGLTQKELAQRMGRPLKTINEIVKGLCAITAETALQLEKVTGIPASFWNSMEAKYRERLTRIQELEQIDALFTGSKPLTQAELQSFGEKNREIMEHPSFKAGVIKDQFKHAILEALGAEGINQSELP
jgi:addiction module HigA family antidote